MMQSKNSKSNGILIIANLHFKEDKNNVIIKNSKFNKKLKFEIVHGDNNIEFSTRKLSTSLKAGEIKILKVVL